MGICFGKPAPISGGQFARLFVHYLSYGGVGVK